jgi:Protein of unknown function (DUF2786)
MSPENVAREKLIGRVRALLSMTTDKGCSEAEALTAASMASKLMEEHDLAIKDIEALKDEPVAATSAVYGKSTRANELHPAAQFTSVAVANFFDCRVWRTGPQISFFGMKNDVVLAHDLLRLIRHAMDQDIARFRRGGLAVDGPGKQAQVTSFAQGMGDRVSERLNFMKAQRSASVKAKGTDIVVIKSEIVTQAYAKTFGANHTGKARKRRDPMSSAAYAAGYSAGDHVGLGQTEIAKPNFDARTPGQRFQEAYNEAHAALLAEINARQAAARAAMVAAQNKISLQTTRTTETEASERRTREANKTSTAPTPWRSAFKRDAISWVKFAASQFRWGLTRVSHIG